MESRASRSIRGSRWWRVVMVVLVLALVGSACRGEGDTGQRTDEADGAEDPAEVPQREITLGWIPWQEAVATTFLWKEILERKGYDVDAQRLEVPAVFAGVAGGDVDVFLDVWLPHTHERYMDEFGDDVVTLGTWFEEATSELTVPSYVAEDEGITSLPDLAESPELFDSDGDGEGEITGVERSARTMRLLKADVMAVYGLEEDFALLEGSTAAMRADLEAAYKAEEPIVVTLWTPHPEYGLKDLTRLEDPEGAWDEPEHLDVIARDGFDSDFPRVAEWLEAFTFSEEPLADLQASVEEADDGDEQAAAAEWLDDNPDVVDEWLGDESVGAATTS